VRKPSLRLPAPEDTRGAGSGRPLPGQHVLLDDDPASVRVRKELAGIVNLSDIRPEKGLTGKIDTPIF